MEEQSWTRNHGGVIMEEKSWRRNHGVRIRRGNNEGEIMKEK